MTEWLLRYEFWLIAALVLVALDVLLGGFDPEARTRHVRAHRLVGAPLHAHDVPVEVPAEPTDAVEVGLRLDAFARAEHLAVDRLNLRGGGSFGGGRRD